MERRLLIVGLLLGACSLGMETQHYHLPLTGGYYLHRTADHMVLIAPEAWSGTTPMIPTEVVRVAWDDRYILAVQQELRRRGRTEGDQVRVPAEGKLHYWLLDTAIPEVHGPYDEPAFRGQCSVQGVPPGWEWKEPGELRPE